MRKLLIVDDEKDFAKGLVRLVSSGFPDLEAVAAHSGQEALRLLDEGPVSLILLDLNMPGLSGLEVLDEVRSREDGTVVIILTAYGTVETAVSALKRGAWDFLTKPVRREDLFRAVSKGLEHNALLDENRRLRKRMAESSLSGSLVGDSAAMRRLRESVAAVAGSDYTVLIRGESGTGKELVAEAVHRLSGRKNGPLVRVNCPAIPETLLESELFGHARGAFTGASSARHGLFVQADGGTLFLDEIGDMPFGLQTKLLRVLQDGEVRPVGSGRSHKVNTRVIAATNQDLEAKIQQGQFREDLFYRLNVLAVTAPPLSERREDIPMLAEFFLQQCARETGLEPRSFSAAALAELSGRPWPGNVRELMNFIRRMTVFSLGPLIGLEDVNGESRAEPLRRDPQAVPLYKDAKNNLLDAFTRGYVSEVLKRTGGNVSAAARISGIERVSLQKIMRRMGMDGGSFKG